MRYAGIYVLAYDYGVSYKNLNDKSQSTGVYIHNNIIYGTGTTGRAPGGGISTAGFHNTIIENNVIHDVTGNGISILYNKPELTYTGVEYYIRNNVITSSSGYGIVNYEPSTHKIIAEYNDVYSNSAGTYSGSGITYTNNLNINPSFANENTHDYHLLSTNGRWADGVWVTDVKTSPLIDAGDPDSDYSKESANGGRINIGAYGNTQEASRSYLVEDTVAEDPVVEDPVSSGDDTIIEAPATEELNIAYGTASIDGDLSEWENVAGVTVYGDSDRTLDKDNIATIKAVYDYTNLYLAYEVTDTNLKSFKVPGEGGLHLDDSIEFYIDTLNNDGTAMQTDDYHLIINLNEALIDDRGTGSGKDYSYVINIVKSLKLQGTLNDDSDTDKGYVIEVAIPWSDIGGQPSNEIVGLFAAVNDRDIDVGRYVLNYDNVLLENYGMPAYWEDATFLEAKTAPEFAAIADVSIDEEETISFTVNATDAEGDELTYSATSIPQGATFNADTATFSWTPSRGEAGTYETVFAVTDDELSDSVNVTIVVNALPEIIEEPVTTSSELNIAFGTVSIDGDLSDWENTVGVDIYGDSDRTSEKENTAIIKAMYDDTYLYLAYDVTDTNLQAVKLPGQGGLHLDDGIELYIDTLNNGGTAMQTDDYHFIINLNEAMIDDRGTGSGKDYSYVINIDSNLNLQGSLNDASDVDTGYTFEIAVPWADIGGKPSNDVVGILAAVNDKDVETAVYLLNYGNVEGSYAIPENWADATIADAPEDIAPENITPVIRFFEPADASTYEEGSSVYVNAFATDEDDQSLSYVIKIDGSQVSTSSSYTWDLDFESAGTYKVEVIVSDGEAEVKSTSIVTVTDLHPRWDVNEDAVVSVLDVDVISQNYGATYTDDLPRWDVNQDGTVNVNDISIVLEHLGEIVN
jgi:hypothetical protein